MPEHRVGTQEEWQAERDELLAEEKELTRRGDELTKKRQDLPWVAVEKDYGFETEDGTQVARRSLRRPLAAADLPLHVRPALRSGLHRLLARSRTTSPRTPPHLAAQRHDPAARLPGAAREAPGLQGADGLGQSTGSQPRATTSTATSASSSTEEELKPFLEGGRFLRYVEADGGGSGTTPEGYVTEAPGLSVYTLEDGVVYRTYVTTSRGLEPAMGYYCLLDRTPRAP